MLNRDWKPRGLTVKPVEILSVPCWEQVGLSDILMVWWLIAEHSGSLSFLLSM